MELRRCFEPECMLEVTCACQCTSPTIYSCQVHFLKHIKLPNKAHSILLDFCDGNKSAILNEISTKHKKLKGKMLREKAAKISRHSELDINIKKARHESDLRILSSPLMKADENYYHHYLQNTSLYNIKIENNRTNLYIYNTETESKEVKILNRPEQIIFGACITQLPNNKIFCYSSKYNPYSGITMIIDGNCKIQVMASGTLWALSSGIYFNNSVYCFGERNITHRDFLACRFDLSENRWIQLAPRPRSDLICNCVIFNRNVLISRDWDKTILVYSIDIDSFSTIPYEFSDYKKKVLINAGERLYLIQYPCGSIYESEIGSEYNWTKFTDLAFSGNPDYVNCLYNKGAMYIACEFCTTFSSINYFKFNLKEKRLLDLGQNFFRINIF